MNPRHLSLSPRRCLHGLVFVTLILATAVAQTDDSLSSIPVHKPRRLSDVTIRCERVALGEPDDYKPCIGKLPNGELLLTAFHQHKRDGNKVLEQTLLFRSKDAGKIDCVVVYKVDRLSRSLLDFARMMEVFEKQDVSFVSVTQQFNTASSMGRLVLDVLLSFAQFEREMISERVRDKIAASRRKGKWSGGMPLLGYTVKETKFIVNEVEAQRVRQIFELYLEYQSLLPTVTEINRRGWTTKRWTTK